MWPYLKLISNNCNAINMVLKQSVYISWFQGVIVFCVKNKILVIEQQKNCNDLINHPYIVITKSNLSRQRVLFSSTTPFFQYFCRDQLDFPVDRYHGKSTYYLIPHHTARQGFDSIIETDRAWADHPSHSQWRPFCRIFSSNKHVITCNVWICLSEAIAIF